MYYIKICVTVLRTAWNLNCILYSICLKRFQNDSQIYIISVDKIRIHKQRYSKCITHNLMNIRTENNDFRSDIEGRQKT